MKHYYFLFIAFLISSMSYGQTTLAIENFDGGTPSWPNNISSLTFVDPSSSAEGLFIQAASSENPNFSGNSAYGRDLAGEAGEPTIDPINFVFENVDTSGYEDITITFDYAVFANADIGTYTPVFDEVDQTPVEYYNDPDAGFVTGTITVNVPNGTVKVGLKIGGTLNGGNDILELDNFKITGQSSSCSASLTAGSSTCNSSSLSTDTYDATFNFLNGSETDVFTVVASLGTPSVNNISTDGTITVSNIPEGTSVTLTLTNTNCSIERTIVSPECAPPACFDLSNGSELFEIVTVQTNTNDAKWSLNSGIYSMNGYCGSSCSETVNTWLIFGPLDMSSTTDLFLSFDSTENFGTTDLLLSYTTSYTDCPSNSSWAPIQTISDGGSYSIDMSSASGTDVFFGIQYLDNGIDGYSSWDLSNVEIIADGPCPSLGSRSTSSCPSLSIEEDQIEGFSMYPNPTSIGYININSKFETIMEASIFDVLGKKVLNTIVRENVLDVSHLKSGLYILKVVQDNATITKKLVIE